MITPRNWEGYSSMTRLENQCCWDFETIINASGRSIYRNDTDIIVTTRTDWKDAGIQGGRSKWITTYSYTSCYIYKSDYHTVPCQKISFLKQEHRCSYSWLLHRYCCSPLLPTSASPINHHAKQGSITEELFSLRQSLVSQPPQS